MEYKITQLNQLQIYSFLLETDQSFKPNPISTQVNLKDYALKLATHANFLVCFENKKIIGITACYLNDIKKEKAFISVTCILPQYHGKGIGKKLTSLCEQEALEKGFKYIEFEVHIDNQPSIKMHEKIGYTIVRQEENHLFMNKKLLI